MCTNYLNSAELSAIEMVQALTVCEDADTVKTLYRVMADMAKAWNISFTPAYRPLRA